MPTPTPAPTPAPTLYHQMTDAEGKTLSTAWRRAFPHPTPAPTPAVADSPGEAAIKAVQRGNRQDRFAGTPGAQENDYGTDVSTPAPTPASTPAPTPAPT